ncbi:MAG: o-succinylbenzoate synthase [Rhizonema sp. PD38]|nr:o-succinylbenzoate synthase [Rhizonema sp. PD38]
MKIERVEVLLLRIPLIIPFYFSGGVVDVKEAVLVKLFSQGLVGYGEGSGLSVPIYLPEYTYETYLVAKNFIAPLVIGKSFDSVEDFVASYSFIKGHNYAKTAAETAFWHLLSQKYEEPLWKLLGGTKSDIGVGESLGIYNFIEDLLEKVAVCLDEGYKRITIKIKPGWDIEPVSAIRDHFGDITLMVDANSAYTLSHLPLFRELDCFGLMMIEQPLAYDDIVDHSTLQREIETPVCLDESILSAENARKAIEIGACRIINIKPGRVGGLLESKRIHDLCASKGVGIYCGGLFETTIGKFFNLSVSSLSNYVYPADMSPATLLFKEDLVRYPLKVHNGFMSLPDSLEQFSIDEAQVERFTVERVMIMP